MLRAALDGEPYAAVARRWGLAVSTVERRVKQLAVRLLQVAGIDGLDPNGTLFLCRLRERRQAILQALQTHEPVVAVRRGAARVLGPGEVDQGARRLRLRSDRPAHDLALYHLPFATGLRPLEVARLQVRDYLAEDGHVRRESVVRAEVAINGRERPLYFHHRQLDEALAYYLRERLHDGQGVGTSSGWRGLDPASPLLLDEQGVPYRPPPGADGAPLGPRCAAIHVAYRRLFRHAGLPGLCTQSARLTLMARLAERGADEDQIGLILGIGQARAVRRHVRRPRRPLPRLAADHA